MAFNRVILVGNLVADPEQKTTTNGTNVTRFRIAVNRSFTRAGEQPKTDFFDIVAWRQTAEFITKYFKKGSLIGIEGAIQTRRYQDKNGNNRTAFEVIANNVQFVESMRDSSSDDGASFSNADVNDFAEMDADLDSDLPF